MNEWARDRARFSHDWLKNTFMVDVLAQLRVCKGTVERNSIDALMLIVSAWRENVQTAHQLIETCEQRMSPTNMLDVEPLVNLSAADIKHLSIIVHWAWIKRFNIETLITEAEVNLEQTTEAIKLLENIISDLPSYGQGNVDCYDIIEIIYSRCLMLAEAMARLPKNIQV